MGGLGREWGQRAGGEVEELKDFFAQTHTLKLSEHNLFDSDTLKTFNFQRPNDDRLVTKNLMMTDRAGVTKEYCC